ncbi:MAG: RimK family alpha-L-glutamate ligase [Thermoanaerobaculia bacterium]
MSRPLDVALASCVNLPERDPDEALLSAALDGAGIRSAVLAWDDPQADFGSARMTVLRSTWDYPHRPGAFDAWLERTAAASELWNPLPVLRWNLHKRYLLEAEAAGLPVVPTELVPCGSAASLAEVSHRRRWDTMVVKPAVSAGSLRTIRIDRDDLEAGEAHLRELVAHRDVLVQKYLPSVEGYGERAVVWIDGELTHAIRKTTRFSGSDESVSGGPVEICSAEAALAGRAIDLARTTLGEPLLYARVDLAPDADGMPMIMELELLEPSLYLEQSNRALRLFVEAIGRRLGS